MMDSKFEIELFSKRHTFSSFGDARHFLEQERQKWVWLAQTPQSWAGSLWNQISQQYAGMDTEISSLESSTSGLPSIELVLAPIADGRILFSDSTLGRKVFEIREAMGDEGAAFAVCFAQGVMSLGNATSSLHLRAAFAISFPQGFEFTELAKRMDVEREQFRSSALTLSQSVSDERLVREGEWRHDRRAFRSIAKRMLTRRRNQWRHAQDDQRDQITTAVNDMRTVEKTYAELMALQAPVQYWRTQAEGHTTAADKLFWALVAFFALATIVLAGAFYLAGNIILTTEPVAGHPATPVALYVVISGSLVSLSTLAFWIGRLLTRMYLSENHLRQDADARAVMTQTYLALTQEKAATEDERKIVLSALFRNAPDGIVKDDGPTEFAGLAALLSSVATKH